ncbi:hypothetical protein OSB04_021140, partial [Centaurea solstitialis]
MRRKDLYVEDSRFIPLTMVKFLDDMERERPIRFTQEQLRIATENFIILLGSEFGTVYKGIFSNDTAIAIKAPSVAPSRRRVNAQTGSEVEEELSRKTLSEDVCIL